MGNEFQMNEAVSQLVDYKVQTGQFRGYGIMSDSYNMVHNLRAACDSFSNRVGPSLMSNTLQGSKVKKNEELLDWLRYLNMCKQVLQTNFQRAIGRMF